MTAPDSRTMALWVTASAGDQVHGAALCQGREGPGWTYPRLRLAGARDGERAAAVLVFYDGADPDRPGTPGSYQTREYDLGTVGDPRELQLAIHLPARYSGWAVRAVIVGGWSWPFTVEAQGPEAPGMTLAAS